MSNALQTTFLLALLTAFMSMGTQAQVAGSSGDTIQDYNDPENNCG